MSANIGIGEAFVPVDVNIGAAKTSTGSISLRKMISGIWNAIGDIGKVDSDYVSGTHVPGPIYFPGYFGANYVFGSGVGSPGAPYGVDQFGDPLNSPANDYTGGLTPVPGSEDVTYSG